MPATTEPFDAVIHLPRLPVCALGLREQEGSLSEIVFLPAGARLKAPASALLRRAAALLRRALGGALTRAELAALLEQVRGTEFQRRVWSALAKIPRGQSVSYGALAARLGSSPRAVGQACARNPLPILVPCHRVLARAGGLGGFAGARSGYLLQTKQLLLELEARTPAARVQPRAQC